MLNEDGVQGTLNKNKGVARTATYSRVLQVVSVSNNLLRLRSLTEWIIISHKIVH